MMRAPHSYCVAVRKPSGEIVTEEMPVARMSEKYPWLKYPMLRGLGTLGQAMSLGMRALKFSANAALDDGSSEKPAEIPAVDDDRPGDLLARFLHRASTNSFRSNSPNI